MKIEWPRVGCPQKWASVCGFYLGNPTANFAGFEYRYYNLKKALVRSLAPKEWSSYQRLARTTTHVGQEYKKMVVHTLYNSLAKWSKLNFNGPLELIWWSARGTEWFYQMALWLISPMRSSSMSSNFHRSSEPPWTPFRHRVTSGDSCTIAVILADWLNRSAISDCRYHRPLQDHTREQYFQNFA